MTALPTVRPTAEDIATDPVSQPVANLAKNSLRRNASWTFVGNATYAACQWGMLVALTKTGDVAMVGRFALGLAVTAPVFMFANLQLRSVLVTDAKEQFEFSDYLGLRLITAALAVTTIIMIGLLGGYRGPALWAILAIGTVKSVESVNDMCYGLMHRRERMDQIAKGQIVNGVLAVTGLSASLWFTRQLLVGILAWAAASLAVLFVWNIPAIARLISDAAPIEGRRSNGATRYGVIRPRWELDTLRELVWLALPLGFVMMMISLNINLPRYVLERHQGEAELGIFASLAYLLVACGMVSAAIGQAAAPRLANDYRSENLAAFPRLVIKMVAVGFALGAVGVLVSAFAGRPLLRLVYTSEYTRHVDVLLWLAVAAGIGFMASALGYAITAARFFRSQVPLNSIVMVGTLTAALLLIPRYGLLGAAWTAVITATVQLAGSGVVLWIALRQRNPTHARPL